MTTPLRSPVDGAVPIPTMSMLDVAACVSYFTDDATDLCSSNIEADNKVLFGRHS